METLCIEASPNGIGCQLLWKVKNEGLEHVRELEDTDMFHCEYPHNLTYLKSVTKLNGLYVGNLEYICTLIGKNNCAGLPWVAARFLWNRKRQGKNLSNHQLDNEKGVKAKTKPVHGVQSHWLLNIDPRKIIIPTLHVEIGLINKFNEELTSSWMHSTPFFNL